MGIRPIELHPKLMLIFFIGNNLDHVLYKQSKKAFLEQVLIER